MSWYYPPEGLAEPSHPFMPARQLFLVGSGSDAGLYVSRFQNSTTFGGRLVLSEDPYPSIKIGDYTLSAVWASGGVDGGKVWFHGDGINCYPVRGLGYIAGEFGPGYWPDWDMWYTDEPDGHGGTERVMHVSGDGWYTVTFPSRYTEDIPKARAAGTYQYNAATSAGIGPITMFWPRLTYGPNVGVLPDPCRVYTQSRDGMQGPRTVGLPSWKHDEDTFTQSMDKDAATSAHWAHYGKARWTDPPGAYIIGSYGHRWQQASAPRANYSWSFAGWASGADGASAVPSADFAATWNGYQFGDESLPVYAGQVAFFEEG